MNVGYRTAVPIKVAIIEDDAQTRMILASWVSEAPGFVLAGAWGEAESALKLLPAKSPDVVLMDINLPGMSGVEAVKQLKRLLPAAQCVIVTVYEDADHIFDALAGGATGYLLKQTSREQLLRALEDVHRGGSPMNSKIARKVVQSFMPATATLPLGDALSPREQEVLHLLARGFLYKEIADQLGVTVPTVNTFVRRVYEKLHVRSRAQAVAKYAPPSQPRAS